MKLEKAVETYKWIAQYNDGKVALQEKTPFKEVLEADKRGEIKRFVLIPLKQELKEIVVNLGGNRRLIYFRRTVGNTGNQFKPFLVYLLGWQETVKGVNKKSIMYIYPNGNIEINDDEATLIDAYIEKEKNGRR